ncbi:hypothetical protein ACT3CE_15835 [Marinifilum sp. RC60d5]|uniref:hypothetical protein n=1 Tax=Marinifilum sp. RC60d5 TaxID=3458414 RepID=UPI0040353430
MKYTVLFCLVVLSFTAKAQLQSKITLLPNRYSSSYEKPLLFTAGDTLLVQTDTIYVINKIRYQFYQNLHKNIFNDSFMDCESTIETLKKQLEASNLAYDQLYANCDQTGKAARESIATSIQSLSSIESKLTHTESKLTQSISKLDTTHELMKQIKKDKKKDKLLFGIGGITIGILCGILVGG